MLRPPPLAKIRFATEMPAAELEQRLRALVGPEGAGAVDLSAFEFAGRVDGHVFRR